MAKIKPQKVLKFKNIPTKQERKSTTTDTKKKKSIVPVLEIVEKKPIKPLIISTKIATPLPSQTPIKKELLFIAEEQPNIASVSTVTEVAPSFVAEEVPILFASVKRESNKKFSPNIFRFITDRWFLTGLLGGFLVLCIVFVGNMLHARIEEKNIVLQERQKIQKEILYWQAKAKQYPESRDASFELSLLEYQLGNFQASQNYLNKVKAIDPNFQEADKLEQLLQKK